MNNSSNWLRWPNKFYSSSKKLVRSPLSCYLAIYMNYIRIHTKVIIRVLWCKSVSDFNSNQAKREWKVSTCDHWHLFWNAGKNEWINVFTYYIIAIYWYFVLFLCSGDPRFHVGIDILPNRQLREHCYWSGGKLWLNLYIPRTTRGGAWNSVNCVWYVDLIRWLKQDDIYPDTNKIQISWCVSRYK